MTAFILTCLHGSHLFLHALLKAKAFSCCIRPLEFRLLGCLQPLHTLSWAQEKLGFCRLSGFFRVGTVWSIASYILGGSRTSHFSIGLSNILLICRWTCELFKKSKTTFWWRCALNGLWSRDPEQRGVYLAFRFWFLDSSIVNITMALWGGGFQRQDQKKQRVTQKLIGQLIER